MAEKTTREAVRRAYGYRCGYCGVHEEELGSELEIDHFQPRSAGGGDDPDNLVYCCPTCNRLKGDFWATGDPVATQRRLLHPKRNDLSVHLHEKVDGLLMALTEIGAFHIERLRLNRPPWSPCDVHARRWRNSTVSYQLYEKDRCSCRNKSHHWRGNLRRF